MEEVAIIGLIVAGVIIVVGVIFYMSKKTREAWEGAAEEMNLQFEKGGLFSKTKYRLVGTHQNREIEVWMRTETRRRRRRGKQTSQRITFTGIRVRLRPEWAQGPQIRMVGLGGKALGFLKDKIMGSDNTEDGTSKILGSDFKVEGSGQSQVMARLQDSGVQGELQQLRSGATRLDIEQGWMTVESQETYRDAGDIVSFAEEMIGSAARVDGGVQSAAVQPQQQAAPAYEESGF